MRPCVALFIFLLTKEHKNGIIKAESTIAVISLMAKGLFLRYGLKGCVLRRYRRKAFTTK